MDAYQKGDELTVRDMRGPMKKRIWNGRRVKVEAVIHGFVYVCRSIEPTDHFLGENIYEVIHLPSHKLRRTS